MTSILTTFLKKQTDKLEHNEVFKVFLFMNHNYGKFWLSKYQGLQKMHGNAVLKKTVNGFLKFFVPK